MDDRHDEEVRRLAEVLATAVRVAGRTRQSVEEQTGMSSGYLSKILGGAVDLRVRHVLEVVGALGLEPGAFFRLAYPLRDDPGSRRLFENVQAALGQGPPPEPAASPAFDEQVKRSLARLLGLAAEDAPQPE